MLIGGSLDKYVAETIALQALAFMVADEDVLSEFVAQTGVTADDLRRGSRSSEFLAGVLDFLLAQEELVLAFCEEKDFKPDEPQRARATLQPASLIM